MDVLLGHLLTYLISLAAGLRQEAFAEARRNKRQQKIDQELATDSARLQAIGDLESLRDQIRRVGTRVAAALDQLDLGRRERDLFMLLTDETFQDDMADWLTAWDPARKTRRQQQILDRMAAVLQQEPEHVEALRQRYFELVERQVFGDPVLAHWRQELGLAAVLERIETLYVDLVRAGDELREQITAQLKAAGARLAEMARGLHELNRQIARRFTEEQRRAALDRYRELALEACDILDLANLPEGDRHIAARQLELRRLYVPLRVNVDIQSGVSITDEALGELQARRDVARGTFAAAKAPSPDEEEADGHKEPPKRVPAGHRLAESWRLVVLGDPGAGKTTLLRWITTVLLLRIKGDPAYRQIPDVKTLPEADWLPIMVRCRDLDAESLSGGLEDLFRRTFRAVQMTPAESAALEVVLREKLAAGEAVLLVDGLDEITQPAARLRFCRQLERLQAAYAKAPMVVSSRIVGYRELGYRIGRSGGPRRSFEHVTIAQLSKGDKDDFARRWCRLTEPPERADAATEGLIGDVHSSDRIERLTGNPMLLTTLALVKRKVGKLPQRRAELYNEAVQVLLNWRAEVDEPVDQREAFYQLEYIAHEMCRRGVQRLREDEIVELFERMRGEYPRLRPLRQHEPEQFLKLLERRTGILVEVGRLPHEGIETPVYEFRHLTFQEYLAGRALAYGRFPGRDPQRSVAENVAPLAGLTQQVLPETTFKEEAVVAENWREALRLCVSCCGDDDVDDVVRAILHPCEREDAKRTRRARAVMAALCLADEPNVGDDVAREVLRVFGSQVGSHERDGEGTTSVDGAMMEIARSEWIDGLRNVLTAEFSSRTTAGLWQPGGLLAMAEGAAAPDDPHDFETWLNGCVGRLTSEDEADATAAALAIAEVAYRQRAFVVPGMIHGLTGMLGRSQPAPRAAVWALGWLCGGHRGPTAPWEPTRTQLEPIIRSLPDDPAMDIWIQYVFEAVRKAEAVDVVRWCVNDARLGVALAALARITGDKTDRRLLSRDLDGRPPWLDRREAIDDEVVARAASELDISESEVRRRFEAISDRLGGRLKLAWRGDS